ncbi:MAG: amino acid adenylation domain-containing protein [Cytophagales bacterium]|nr:amino acid adenylation domain-containing protein [Cytophagales bacterium]
MELTLTLPQQDIFYEQILYPGEPTHNIGAKIEIKGVLNTSTLQSAYVEMLDQNDAFRMVFNRKNHRIQSGILIDHMSELKLLDFSTFEDPEQSAHQFMQSEFSLPMDILSGKLLHKFILIKIGKQLHYLFSVYNHIITDGWGTSLMFQRLVSNYNELLEHKRVVSKYPFSYKDFIADDKSYEDSNNYRSDKDYWVKRFDPLPESLLEKTNATETHAASTRKELYVERNQFNRIGELAKEWRISSFHLMLSVLFTYLGRRYGKEDISIGLPTLNRNKAIFKKTVGLFMGITPLRMKLDFEESIPELAVRIKDQLRIDYRYQRFPLGRLLQELNCLEDRQRLFNITLSYEKHNYASQFTETRTTVMPLSHGSERVALAIYIREFDDEKDVRIDFDYNTSFFTPDDIHFLAGHFEKILHGVIEAPGRPAKDVIYITKEEQKIFDESNKTDQKFPDRITLLDLIKGNAKDLPANSAVRDSERSLAFLELERISNQIANFLTIEKSNGNINQPYVGLLLERDSATLAIILGIFKAGMSYIPIDTNMPELRVRAVLEESLLDYLIVTESAKLDAPGVSQMPVKRLLRQSQQHSEEVIFKIERSDIAYIIYTSGSTGRPKGVKISHGALVNLLLSMKERPGFDQTDVLFAVSTYSFDISILEFFLPLIAGGTVYIASKSELNDPKKLIGTLEAVKPSVIQGTPSFFQFLINAGWKGDSGLTILCGGDRLSKELAHVLIPICSKLWNMYGPTETTIWSSVHRVSFADQSLIIGKPIANTQFYILDSYQTQAPVTTWGNLYIGGDGISDGYFNNERLTKSKFISNPFKKGSTLYDTGDIARWRIDGSVEFLGRQDGQIKIRGYRIESAEIETKLVAISEISQAIVVASKDGNSETVLVAYVISNDTCDPVDIKRSLQRELPDYMVPSVIKQVEAFPQTHNNKIDRVSLSKIPLVNAPKEATYLAPTTPLDLTIQQYWKEVLGTDHSMSLDVNFFQLGGHSLNAVKLIHLINKNLSVSLELGEVFKYPTIAQIVKRIEENLSSNSTSQIPIADDFTYYPLTPAQYEIWLASQSSDMSIAYNLAAAFYVDGALSMNRIAKTFDSLVKRHEILRTNFLERNGTTFMHFADEEVVSPEYSSVTLEQSEVQRELNNFVNTEFDLEHDLLIKFMIIHVKGGQPVIAFCSHHTILDGWSLELLTKDFMHLYDADSDMPSLPGKSNEIQFKDYSQWMLNHLRNQDVSTFWKKYLEGYEFKPSIQRNQDSITQASTGEVLSFTIQGDDYIHMKSLVATYKITTHTLLISVLVMCIKAKSQHRDFCLGIINSGRAYSQTTNLIGMLVKTIILRVGIKDDQSLMELFEDIQENVLLIAKHPDLPTTINKNKMIDLLVTYQDRETNFLESLHMNNTTFHPLDIQLNHSKFPLVVNFDELESSLKVTISYDIKLYAKDSVQSIQSTFEQIVKLIEGDGDQLIAEIVEENGSISEELTIDFDF